MIELKTVEDYRIIFHVSKIIENDFFYDSIKYVIYYRDNNFLKANLHKNHFNFKEKHLNQIMRITFKQRLLILRNAFIKIYKEII
jgi:hypothetical protein